MSTIKDVAREACVSVGTVSHYLNGMEVKESNKIKIEQAISKLDFKVNPIAKGLRTRKTNTIGVIIPSLTDIYSTMIVGSIEQALFEFGYNIFTCDSRGSIELERQKAKLLADKKVDGLIIYPCSEDMVYITELQVRNIPVVVVDTAIRGANCDQILTDNIYATYSATEWLISKNHKRIGIINGKEKTFTARERLKGYRRALEDYSIEFNENLIKARGFDEKSGYESLIELMTMDQPPSAVIACNYYTSIGMSKAIYDLRIKVPDQLSVIGFDNIGLSELIRPPLSIIVQPMEELGKCAAETLLRRISGDNEGFPSVRRLKTDFIVRESTKQI
jgi:LacI family transcriptional regulator